ncbi:unnamed protein product [Meganyctiphanes norvegica]|uniref:NADH dehydrogenase subunit 6 n=1 Tax=Meganyctiphanes norvegica TaxID=48144 RepID=A0AAV2SCL9_MEGNR
MFLFSCMCVLLSVCDLYLKLIFVIMQICVFLIYIPLYIIITLLLYVSMCVFSSYPSLGQFEFCYSAILCVFDLYTLIYCYYSVIMSVCVYFSPTLVKEKNWCFFLTIFLTYIMDDFL